MKRADPSKKFFRPYVKKLRKFSCAPFGLVQPKKAIDFINIFLLLTGLLALGRNYIALKVRFHRTLYGRDSTWVGTFPPLRESWTGRKSHSELSSSGRKWASLANPSKYSPNSRSSFLRSAGSWRARSIFGGRLEVKDFHILLKTTLSKHSLFLIWC